mgnify:CR=1 FL=1|jgi:uncharacterized protein (TIGR00369 family)
MRLQDDGRCFACGAKNPRGLGLSFEHTPEGVKASFTPSWHHQGYKALVHGGIISTLLDEAMVHAALKEGLTPITAELQVRFHRPLEVGQAVEVRGRLTGRRRRLLWGQAQVLRSSDQLVIATAEAKLLAHAETS